MKRDFIAVNDLSRAELMTLFDQAQTLARAFQERSLPPLLKGKRIALWFTDTGFRNRVAFELGIKSLGGEAIYIPGQLGDREAIEDVAAYLDNWFDAVVIRAPSYEALQQLALAARIPVINARTPHNHPCEILGDLAFVYAERGTVDGLTVVFVGEAANLCHSWFEAAVPLPLRVIQVCPEGYEVDDHFLVELQQLAVGEFQVTNELEPALKQADIIYTDCWPRRHTEEDKEFVPLLFEPYQITPDKLALTPSGAMFLPCPPVTRGEEVSAEAMTSSHCRVYEAKAYLLHAQNALLAQLVGHL